MSPARPTENAPSRPSQTRDTMRCVVGRGQRAAEAARRKRGTQLAAGRTLGAQSAQRKRSALA